MISQIKKEITVLIIDLDDTLFDWVSLWYYPFKKMLERLIIDSGIPKDVLEEEFKKVFTKYGTCEYSFAIQELPSLVRKHPNQDLSEIYKDAISIYRMERKKRLKLFPNVLKTLRYIKAKGSLIVAYTESMEFYTKNRLKKLGLDGIIDFVYTPQDHDIPSNVILENKRRYKKDYYELKFTKIKHTPKNEKKPNPKILLTIISDVNASIKNTIYVGDKLVKDISMAQTASVMAVHAKYGVADKRKEYKLLRKVTYWTDEEVDKEKNSSEEDFNLRYILRKSLRELLNMFNFSKFIPAHKGGYVMDDEKIQSYIEIWKKTIDVQRHFNEIELKIRNLAVTVLVAVSGAAGFALKENMKITILGQEYQLALWLLIVGFMGFLAFYLMDRYWYHKLLYGAVEQALFIENRLKGDLPELGLTSCIKKWSSSKFFGITIRSTMKIHIFYLPFLAILGLTIYFLFANSQ